MPKHVPGSKPYVSIRTQADAGVKTHMFILTAVHLLSASRFPDAERVAQTIDFSWALAARLALEPIQS